jgi:hypothetical protein
VISTEQWPRALLRAELRAAGFDAIGASSLARALRYPPHDAERGPVRLIIVDARAVAGEPEGLAAVRRRFAGVPFVIIQGAGAEPSGPWAAVLERPLAIGQIEAAVRRLVPLPPRRGET